jgi:hypothetical protein
MRQVRRTWDGAIFIFWRKVSNRKENKKMFVLSRSEQGTVVGLLCQDGRTVPTGPVSKEVVENTNTTTTTKRAAVSWKIEESQVPVVT